MTDIKTRIKHLALTLKIKAGREYTPANIEEDYLQCAESMINSLAEKNIQILTYLDEEYPQSLADAVGIEGTHLAKILYIKTTTPLDQLFGGKKIAVVGTRDPSLHGIYVTRELVSAFSGRPTIVSGLAYGIDTEAHREALARGLPTIAVLPCGNDMVYPYRNRELAEQIVNTPGCALVSPFSIGTAPEPICFVQRNHVIAGMSQATVVVESRSKGGALVTARRAKSYERDVYAVPGKIDDIRSAGCNALIAEGTAKLLLSTMIDRI